MKQEHYRLMLSHYGEFLGEELELYHLTHATQRAILAHLASLPDPVELLSSIEESVAFYQMEAHQKQELLESILATQYVVSSKKTRDRIEQNRTLIEQAVQKSRVGLLGSQLRWHPQVISQYLQANENGKLVGRPETYVSQDTEMFPIVQALMGLEVTKVTAEKLTEYRALSFGPPIPSKVRDSGAWAFVNATISAAWSDLRLYKPIFSTRGTPEGEMFHHGKVLVQETIDTIKEHAPPLIESVNNFFTGLAQTVSHHMPALVDSVDIYIQKTATEADAAILNSRAWQRGQEIYRDSRSTLNVFKNKVSKALFSFQDTVRN